MLRRDVVSLSDVLPDVVEFERDSVGDLLPRDGVHHDVDQFPVADDDRRKEVDLLPVLHFPLVRIMEEDGALRVDPGDFFGDDEGIRRLVKGERSSGTTGVLMRVPGEVFPGMQTIIGTRMPPW